LAKLRCDACGGAMRPHVLWFDEYYEEGLFRFESGLSRVGASELLIFVGCSGAANLPRMAARVGIESGAFIVDVNLEPNPFSRLAEELARDSGADPSPDAARTGRRRGAWLRGPADQLVPELIARLLA